MDKYRSMFISWCNISWVFWYLVIICWNPVILRWILVFNCGNMDSSVSCHRHSWLRLSNYQMIVNNFLAPAQIARRKISCLGFLYFDLMKSQREFVVLPLALILRQAKVSARRKYLLSPLWILPVTRFRWPDWCTRGLPQPISRVWRGLEIGNVH